MRSIFMAMHRETAPNASVYCACQQYGSRVAVPRQAPRFCVDATVFTGEFDEFGCVQLVEKLQYIAKLQPVACINEYRCLSNAANIRVSVIVNLVNIN